MAELNGGMSAYEQFMVANKQTNKGTAVGGLVTGCVGVAAAIGAWIFAGTYASKAAKVAEAKADALSGHLTTLTQLQMGERAERVNWQNYNQPTLKNYVDVVSGSHAAATAQAQAIAGLGSTGQAQPFAVSLYQPAMPCGCPATGV